MISNPLADSEKRNRWTWLSDPVKSSVCWFRPFSTWPKVLDFALKESGWGQRFCLLSLSPQRWLLVERWDMQLCRRWSCTASRLIKAHSPLQYFSTLSVCEGESGWCVHVVLRAFSSQVPCQPYLNTSPLQVWENVINNSSSSMGPALIWQGFGRGLLDSRKFNKFGRLCVAGPVLP